MNRSQITVAIGLASLTIGCTNVQFAPPPTVNATHKDAIVAALPVIPDAKFMLTDYGGVGDYKSMNTDAFHNAVGSKTPGFEGRTSSAAP